MATKREPKEEAPPNGGWGIFTDDRNCKWLTNFEIEVVSIVNIYNAPEAKPASYVKFKLCFGAGQYSEEVIEPLLKLDKINWFDKDIRCRLNPAALAKAQHHLADRIRKVLPHTLSEERYRLMRLGVHIVKGEPVFCAGGEVIRPPLDDNDNSTIIEPDAMPYNLDYDPDLSEEEAAMDMLNLLSLSPDLSRPLFAYNLLCFMRELYVYAWKAPQFCLNPWGLSDSQKTTISAFFSQLYNRRKGIKGPPRLDTSIAESVRTIYAMSDCVVVFDDLCPSDTKSVQREQEILFMKIVRMIGDGVKPGRFDVKGVDTEKPPPTSGVNLTGEYPIGTGSDAARMLPIEVSPLSNETLQQLAEFQKDKPLVVPTFYRNFIQWFISNYTWAGEFLRGWWEAYSKTDFATMYGLKIHNRLRETHFYLRTAYIMFLQYCLDKEYLSEEDAQAMQESFLKLITQLMLNQQERVDQGTRGKPDVNVDYLAFIRMLYMDGTIKMAPSLKEFDVQVYDGVIHLGCLYIYGEKFREIIDAANANLEEILDDLEAQGALQPGKDNKTTQVRISPRQNRRCYAIKLNHLM